MITVDNISHIYALPGKRELMALQDTSFTVQKGELVVIIGESGCGKSTLLNLIAGLFTPTMGKLSMNGDPITGPHHSRMMMFQQPCLLPWLTVAENIAFGCNLRGQKEGLDKTVNEFIELMGLSGFEKTFPSALSAGMKQRVALARALIGEPQVLLLDECFSEIDVATRAKLLKLVLELWKKLELSIIHVTHDIDEGLLLGQRIILISERPGRVKHIFDVPLPLPRTGNEPELVDIKNDILEKFDG